MNHTRLLPLLAASLGLAACSLTPVASLVPGYLTTPKGELLVNEDGRCWRTADWRPALAVVQCDPEVVAAREAEAAPEPEAKKDEKNEEKKAADTGDQDSGPHEGIAHFGFIYQPPTDDVEGSVAGTGSGSANATPGTAADGAAAAAGALPRYRDEVVFAPLVLNSDASFYFGDDHLTREGKTAVGEIAGIIKARRARDLKIAVIGHSDRIGSDKANLDLSRRRAAAVKAELVAQGIAANVIETAGMGAAQPVTQREDCPDYLVKCELIACLKPDRRVEIRTRGRMENGTRQVPVTGRIEFPRAPPRTGQHEAHAVCPAG